MSLLYCSLCSLSTRSQRRCAETALILVLSCLAFPEGLELNLADELSVHEHLDCFQLNILVHAWFLYIFKYIFD